MNCNEFQELLPREKTEFIGSLIHACQSDSQLFLRGQNIIKAAQKKGLFDGVAIHPEDWDSVPVNQILETVDEI